MESKAIVAEWRLNDLDALTGNLSVKLDCENGGFGYVNIRNTGLSFLASCNKVESYLEGFRFTLTIGNPYSMKFDGFTAMLGYGETLANPPLRL